MAWWYKEWGGIRKAETKVVRIKGRRRDKGGEGGRSKSAGWEDQPPFTYEHDKCFFTFEPNMTKILLFFLV
jgi:hypothetical protein